MVYKFRLEHLLVATADNSRRQSGLELHASRYNKSRHRRHMQMDKLYSRPNAPSCIVNFICCRIVFDRFVCIRAHPEYYLSMAVMSKLPEPDKVLVKMQESDESVTFSV